MIRHLLSYIRTPHSGFTRHLGTLGLMYMARYKLKKFHYIEAVKKTVQFVLPEKLLNSLGFRLFRSWLFQGALYMHWDELLFRICVELLLITGLFGIISYYVYQLIALAAAVFIGHTLIWLFNAHFWALSTGSGRRMVKNTPDKILGYFSQLNARLASASSIEACAMFGSLARGEFTENSDLDIWCCRRPGFVNAIRAFTFGVRERMYAFIGKIPVEIYFYDASHFSRLDEREVPIIFKDVKGTLRSLIPESIMYEAYPMSDQKFFSETSQKAEGNKI